MRHDDLHVRPVNRHIVQMHGVAVGQTQSATATHAAAYAAVARVKNGGQFVGVDHVVNRPDHFVVRVAALHRRMKLEAAHTLFFDQALGLTRTHLAFVRINTGKGNHHVAVVTRGLGDFLIWNTPTSHV